MQQICTKRNTNIFFYTTKYLYIYIILFKNLIPNFSKFYSCTRKKIMKRRKTFCWKLLLLLLGNNVSKSLCSYNFNWKTDNFSLKYTIKLKKICCSVILLMQSEIILIKFYASNEKKKSSAYFLKNILWNYLKILSLKVIFLEKYKIY